MASSPDIQQLVSDRLTMEAYGILKEVATDKPGTNGGYYAWFQNLIARAEETNDRARALAAVLVMEAYGEELSDPSSMYLDTLLSRVRANIEKMVAI
jgi:hypothetical protein